MSNEERNELVILIIAVLILSMFIYITSNL